MRFALLFVLTLTTSLNAQLRRVEHKWIKVAEESFALAPGARKHVDISGEGKYRVEISASSPVAVGIFQALGEANSRVFFDETPCGAVDVLKTSKECDAPTGEKLLAVLDRRDPVDKLLAMLLLSGAMMDRSTAPNKITVSLYRWTCTANCASLPEKEKPNNATEHD
jgi:hypothetical protein